MASLHVGDVPDALHERIRRLAEANGRALGAEVVALLERAVGHEKALASILGRRPFRPEGEDAPDSDEDRRVRHKKALDRMWRNRHVYPPGKNVPDSVELLREDRAR